MPLEPLPIDPFRADILAAVRTARAVVISAAPGAGKTTRVPPALASEGAVILLQPRRVAARAIARRIADEQGWTIGGEVGWQVRFERRFSERTRLLVATEGILTARLQQDPLLTGFQTIVLDEFHERSIHADLGLALARQAWLARPDLRLVVMSATLDTERVSAFLGHCPVIEVPGRLHPLDVTYAPTRSMPDAVFDMVAQTSGQILCFLPGAPEIGRAIGEIQRRVSEDIELVPLYGSLEAAAQDAAISPSPRRRIVLATNIAETTLTVPGVTGVVDSGLQKVARYDAARGVDSLETERISRDSADQRAGRAGRIAPGRVTRLWAERDRMRSFREPDIKRIDLASAALDVLAWGGDPRTLEWFEPPDREPLDAALYLLQRLGAVGPFDNAQGREGRLTTVGDRLRRLPLHPRLGRILVAAGGAREAAAACALLSERHFLFSGAGPHPRLAPRTATTSSDLLSAIDDWPKLPWHVRSAAESIERAASALLGTEKRAHVRDDEFRRALLAGYPDRVAKRRAPGSDRVLLASGHGGVIAPESGVREGEFLLAIDVQAEKKGQVAGARGETASSISEARIRIASGIEREWLVPTRAETRHRFDSASGTVRAEVVELYDALPLGERPATADPEQTAALLTQAYIARGMTDDDERVVRRLRFAGHEADLPDLIARAAASARRLDDIDLAAQLPHAVKSDIDRLAPERIVVPSGRTARLEYQADGSVSAAVKLQELFGLAESPRIGPHRTPVVLELLAPNGRPVQVTRDLRSFWNTTYPTIRRELRGRYPKHPWPEDPWTARPTARTKRK
jgi:ATP-dependent helicase HrpB